MWSDDYQKDCLVTWNIDQSIKDQRANAALGLAGEAGETVDLLKKFLFHGHSIDKEKLAKELGDIQYYIAITAYIFDIELSDIMKMNIEKLRKRYNGGGFSKELSINRDKNE